MDWIFLDTVSPGPSLAANEPADDHRRLSQSPFSLRLNTRVEIATASCRRNNESLERKRQARVVSPSPRICVHRVIADLTREGLIGKRRCAVHQVLHAERDRRVAKSRVAPLQVPDVIRADPPTGRV